MSNFVSSSRLRVETTVHIKEMYILFRDKTHEILDHRNVIAYITQIVCDVKKEKISGREFGNRFIEGVYWAYWDSNNG